jgi:archaellum component FlaC
MKKRETHSSADLKRYLGALHEEHMAAIKAMAEQFVDVNRKLDAHTKQLDAHTKQLNTQTTKLDAHTRILDSHTEMIGGLATNLEKVKLDVEIIKSDIGIIKNDLKQKVDRNEFAILERRVLRLESKIK